MLSVEKPLALGSSAAGATVPPGDGAESVCQLLDSTPLAHLAHHATTPSTQPLGTGSRLPDFNFSTFFSGIIRAIQSKRWPKSPGEVIESTAKSNLKSNGSSELSNTTPSGQSSATATRGWLIASHRQKPPQRSSVQEVTGLQ